LAAQITKTFSINSSIDACCPHLRGGRGLSSTPRTRPYYFIYPRCPRINGTIERFQKSLQEEFVNHHLYLIEDTILFNQKMIEYLIWYNTKDCSLGLKSPMDYLLSKGLMSKKYVTHTLGVLVQTP